MPRKPNPNRPPWASAIAEARMKAGLTQEELSEKTSIPLTSIKKYERGVRVPRYDVLQDIASATGADINTFIPPENQRAKSDEFSDLVNPAFSEILKFVAKGDIVIVDVSSKQGYSSDQIEIVNRKNLKSRIYSKTKLVVEIAKIRGVLKNKYNVELNKLVKKHLNKVLDDNLTD